MTLNPQNVLDGFLEEIELLQKPSPKKQHARVLKDILDNLVAVDLRARAGLKADEPITQKVQVVVTVETVLATARRLSCGLCRNLDFVYAYNGEYWQLLNKSEL